MSLAKSRRVWILAVASVHGFGCRRIEPEPELPAITQSSGTKPSSDTPSPSAALTPVPAPTSVQSPPPSSTPASTTAATAPSPQAKPTDPASVVRAWLALLRSADSARIADSTAFPFSYRTMNKIKKCEGTVTGPGEMGTFLGCFQKEETLFLEQLGYAGELRITVNQGGQAPRPLRSIVHDIGDGEILASSVITGDGVAYTLGFIVETRGDAPRVRVFARDVEFPE